MQQRNRELIANQRQMRRSLRSTALSPVVSPRNTMLVRIHSRSHFIKNSEASNELLEKKKEALVPTEYKVQSIKHLRDVNHNLHRRNSLELEMKLRDKLEYSLSNSYLTKGLKFNHVVIGGGVGATLLYPEFSPKHIDVNLDHPELPGIIVLNDPTSPNTWHKEGNRLMGQPEALHGNALPCPSSMYSPTHGSRDPLNPYGYVVASHFYDALITSQNILKMPVVNLRAIKIESQQHSNDAKFIWEYKDARNRILIDLGNEKQTYIYSSAVEICTGLGPAKRLTSEQVGVELADKLIKSNKLIYACDGDKELKGEVVMYGGSAVNAAWIAEIVNGRSQPDAVIKFLVSPNFKPLDDLPTTLNRLIADMYHSGKFEMALGEIQSVTQAEDGRLKIIFQAPITVCERYTNLAGKTIICDHLVVARGQVPNPLVAELKDFVVCYDDSKTIPLGTHSQDMTIRTWGAAGSTMIGLSQQQRAEVKPLITKHADSTLVENNAEGGISRSSYVIPKLAEKLRENGMFSERPHSPYHSRTPRVNQVTKHDLSVFFSQADAKLTSEQCDKYADEVIKERLRKIPNCTKPTGIYSIERLVNVLPDSLLVKFQQCYFPAGIRSVNSTRQLG
jgi:hypothetical protein